MKAADTYTIEKVGIPSLVLMERAALETVRVLKDRGVDFSDTLVVCGSGNNGGDGSEMCIRDSRSKLQNGWAFLCSQIFLKRNILL